jgi:hypothetical protein
VKHILSASTLFSALVLLGSAVPGQAGTISFTSALGGGDITTQAPPGPSATILGLTESFSTLTVTGGTNPGTYQPLFLTELLTIGATTETLTMTGTLTGCTTCSTVFPTLTSSTTLATIVFNSATALTANAGTTSASVNMPSLGSITSITLNSTFLADLGLTAPFSLSALGNVSSASQPGNYQNQSSGVLTFANGTVGTPEPSSGLLLGSALLGGVMLLKRRFVNGTRS